MRERIEKSLFTSRLKYRLGNDREQITPQVEA